MVMITSTRMQRTKPWERTSSRKEVFFLISDSISLRLGSSRRIVFLLLSQFIMPSEMPPLWQSLEPAVTGAIFSSGALGWMEEGVVVFKGYSSSMEVEAMIELPDEGAVESNLLIELFSFILEKS